MTAHWGEPPPDYDGPRTIYDFLPTLKKQGAHGTAFHYVTPNTDTLAWIIRRVTGKSVDAKRAKRMGLVDEAVPLRVLENTARMVTLEAKPRKPLPFSKRIPKFLFARMG